MPRLRARPRQRAPARQPKGRRHERPRDDHRVHGPPRRAALRAPRGAAALREPQRPPRRAPELPPGLGRLLRARGRRGRSRHRARRRRRGRAGGGGQGGARAAGEPERRRGRRRARRRPGLRRQRHDLRVAVFGRLLRLARRAQRRGEAAARALDGAAGLAALYAPPGAAAGPLRDGHGAARRDVGPAGRDARGRIVRRAPPPAHGRGPRVPDGPGPRRRALPGLRGDAAAVAAPPALQRRDVGALPVADQKPPPAVVERPVRRRWSRAFAPA